MTELEAVRGLGPAAAKKLRENHITCAEILAFQEPMNLNSLTKLGEMTCMKIVDNARQTIGLSGVKSGIDIDNQWKEKRRLTTGLVDMDQKLHGGFGAGSVVELYGEAASGKTQWCHQLAVTAQLSEDRGGLSTRVLWLDTENSFMPLTIRANAVRMGLDPDMCLERIHVLPIIGRDHLLSKLTELPMLVHEMGISLVIIDNLGQYFRPDTHGLSFRHIQTVELTEVFRVLKGMANALGVLIVYTNQVYEVISTYGGNPNAPVGFHIMSHSSTHRLYTRKARQDQRKVVLRDNAGLPPFEHDIWIDWGGLYESRQEQKAVSRVIVDYLSSLEGYGIMGNQRAVGEEGVA